MKRNQQLSLEEVLTDKTFEEEFIEIPAKKFIFQFVFLISFIIGLIGFIKLINIGIFNYKNYLQRSFLNFNEISFKLAPRGIIKDRFGKPLLENKAIVNLYINFSFLSQSPEEREKALDFLSQNLNLPKEKIVYSIKNHNWDQNQRVLLKPNLSHDELIKITAANLKGIDLIDGLRRDYKNFPAFAHILGYIGFPSKEDLKEKSFLLPEDVIGKSGLEAYYDQILRGENGFEIFLKNAQGKRIEKIESFEPKPGQDLITTIDGEFQEFLYQRLKLGLETLGSKRGVGLAVNPQNGEVLALVSLPSFDFENLEKALKDPDLPFFNRAVSGLYNPGSTIKPLVALAALKEGIIHPEKEIYSPGFIEVPNPYYPEQPYRFLDWKPHGWVNLYSAIARSSNVYFYAIGGGFENQEGLGIEKLKKWWGKFGLNEKTGIDLLEEKSGFLPDTK